MGDDRSSRRPSGARTRSTRRTIPSSSSSSGTGFDHAGPLHEAPARAVHHDLVDRGIGEQRLQRAESHDRVQQIRHQHLAAIDREQRVLGGDQALDPGPKVTGGGADQELSRHPPRASRRCTADANGVLPVDQPRRASRGHPAALAAEPELAQHRRRAACERLRQPRGKRPGIDGATDRIARRDPSDDRSGEHLREVGRAERAARFLHHDHPEGARGRRIRRGPPSSAT